MREVNAKLLKVPSGTPVSSVFDEPRLVADAGSAHWLEVGDGWFAIALTGSDREHTEDPQLMAFQWVRTTAVVRLLLGDRVDVQGSEEFREPTRRLIGFSPLTLGAALDHETKHGRRPMLTASHDLTDGSFRYSSISAARHNYQFASLNPEPDELAIGVRLGLLP